MYCCVVNWSCPILSSIFQSISITTLNIYHIRHRIPSFSLPLHSLITIITTTNHHHHTPSHPSLHTHLPTHYKHHTLFISSFSPHSQPTVHIPPTRYFPTAQPVHIATFIAAYNTSPHTHGNFLVSFPSHPVTLSYFDLLDSSRTEKDGILMQSV